MSTSTLVAAHLSPLYPPSPATPTLTVQTKQSHVPLPVAATDLPQEHATYSRIFESPETGTMLMRVIHGGLTIELIPLTHEASPLRIVFPAAIMPHPHIIVLEGLEVHIFALTNVGSLFRIVLPVVDGTISWHNISPPGKQWWREYVIARLQGNAGRSLLHVQSSHCIVISLPEGSLLRLETQILGNNLNDDEWDEHVIARTSFLGSLTSLLHSGASSASDVVSFATIPHPSEIGYIWSLSRDRTLRVWTGDSCIAARQLAATSSHISPTKVPSLLQEQPQQLLRAFIRPNTDEPCVVAFIPSESALNAGQFHIINASHGQLHVAEVTNSSPDSAHCHLQDFVIKENVLYTLWDRQGQSFVQWRNILVDTMEPDEEKKWEMATYSNEIELTPAYLDELLLSPGSLTDRYFEAIMRPDTFSDLTLRLALLQYTDSCLSLPGVQPPQLLTSYNSLGENIAAVVGCTVQLTKDPGTGAPQYEQYWSALKRDWEGFIARCREIERSARWPLAIAVSDSQGPLVVERERLASVVDMDLSMSLHRNLSLSIPVDSSSALLEILWMLQSKLGQRFMATLEAKVVEMVQQQSDFLYADIIQDANRKLSLRDHLDEGLESWISGRLQSIEDIQTAARDVIDFVGGMDRLVKTEDDIPVALISSPALEWRKALVVSYATKTIHARYDQCLALITLLFFFSEQLDQWDPSLLAEILVVFRGVAILRYISRQPAGTKSPDPGSEEDVIAGLRNMNVSTSTGPRYASSSSLFQQLLDQINVPAAIPIAAHTFLDETDLLGSLSPASVTTSEVTFCSKIRALGYHEAARDSLNWLPRTPGVCYVLAQLWIDEGRYDDAASLMEQLAGVFGPESGISPDDEKALRSVLPRDITNAVNSPYEFYVHAMHLFRAAESISHQVTFSQLAISVAPSVSSLEDRRVLWSGMVQGFIDLSLYHDAYAALIECPIDNLKRDLVGQLIYRMCEENAVDRLMSFNFSGFAAEVEEALSFKVRNADPRVRPFYSRILYTWYISRGDYRNAAVVMYQRARKLWSLMESPADFLGLAELQLEAYVVSINALSLVDPASAWFVMPVLSEYDHESRKRRKLSVHVPESRYSFGKKDAEVVQLADIQYEYALLSAQIELANRDPHFLAAGGLSLSPSSIVFKLAQRNRFSTAMATARILDVDMTDIFAHLTHQCIRLSRNPDAVIGEDTSDWLLTDKVSSWPGLHADRGWRYLRQSLEKYDDAKIDFTYTKIVLETILAFDRALPPPWLVQSLEQHHPEFLIRAYLRFDLLDFALEQTLSMMRKSDAQLAKEQPRGNFATWLPYTLIDQILAAAEPPNNLTPRARILAQELQAQIASRLKRIQRLGQAAQ